jgi:alpha-D-xyloside xylohydrolase
MNGSKEEKLILRRFLRGSAHPPRKMRLPFAGRVLLAMFCLAFRAAHGQGAPGLGAVTAYNAGGGSATLSASVNPQGSETLVWFNYGLSGAYGSTSRTTGSDNAEGYSTWSYGSNGGAGLGPATYLEGSGGGIYLDADSSRIDGTASFGEYAGSGSGNSQAMDRQIINAQTSGTLSLSMRFNVSNSVAFSGFNLKYGQGAHFGDDELISVGLTPATGSNEIAVDGGGATINLGSTVPGQIIDFTMSYDCTAGTYTLGAKFRASSTYTMVSGTLKATGQAAAYLGFGNFNTGSVQNLIFDDIVINTTASAGSGNAYVTAIAPVSGLTPDSTYHYQAVAQNANGTVYGPDQTFGFPLKPPANATYLSYDDGAGNEARIYTATGHIALAEPDLSGNPLNIAEVFTPPSALINGASYNLGPVLTSTSIANGLQLTQSLAGTTVTTQLTFPSAGVMRYQVVNWNGLAPAGTQFIAGSGTAEHFFGFGEKFDSVDQTGNKVHMLTYDNPGTKGDSSYKPVPYFMSTAGYGFHLGTTAEAWFDMRNSYTDRYVIQNLDGNLVMNLIAGPQLPTVLTRFTGYVGRPYLPPAWVFGPWVSCDIWPTGGEVRYAVSTYLADGIPLSAIVFDSPWEADYNDFTWNMTQFGAAGTLDASGTWQGFSSVTNMMTFLQQSGLKAVCWMTPFTDVNSANQTINNEPGGQNDGEAANYPAGLAGNYFVMSSSTGPALVVPWWGGNGSPVDFTNPGAATWFTGELTSLINQSDVTAADGSAQPVIGGFKDDDGESGNGTNTYIPTTATYSNGQTGVDMQNGFCIQYHKTVSSVLGSNGILMARSGYAGTGAYPGCWSGDNEPNFAIDSNGLDSVMIAGASAGLSGMAIWGSDIGGYLSGPFESNPADLFQRWAQFGAFTPIMEMHRTVSTGNLMQYPWGYGSTALSNYVTYARLHTQLFPFIYSYAKEAAQDGLPIIRAPVLMNQTDPGTYALNQTYLFGNEFLVAPMNALNATSRGVYLPAGTWYDYWTQASYTGAQAITWTNSDPTKIPVFVRSGSIIPMLLDVPQTLCDANYVNNAAVTAADSGLQFLIYPGSGTAAFNVYDGTAIQSNVNGTVTNVALNSVAREVALQVFTSAPKGVQRNGVRMPQFASMAAYTSETLGWIYSGGFLYVKFNHGGGPVNIGFGPDTVGDGIPDSWRNYYGVTNDLADTDGSGFTNYEDYLAGTDPNDAGSRFTAENTSAASGTGMTITWQSQAGLTYEVQSTTALTSGSWQNASSVMNGTGGILTWTDSNAVSGAEFYRVLIPQ